MRSGRRPLLLMGLVWLLVVAAVGSVTYLVVDRAGKEIGDTSGTSQVVAAPSLRTSTTSRPTPSSPRPTATRTRTTTPKSTPKSTPTPTVSAVTPVPSRRTTPIEAPPTPTPTTSPTRTASFTTKGGTVVASCTGDRMVVGSIRPRNGWSLEREVEGDHLEVHFKASEDEVEIKIRCRDGVPTEVQD